VNASQANALVMDATLVEALLVGRPAEAINWCEADYAVLLSFAEFWNSISSLLFVLAGASMWTIARRLRLRPTLAAAGPLTVATGLASTLFHATLSLRAQRADEVMENLTLVALLHGASPSSTPARAVAHGALTSVGILTVSAFLFTELHLITVAFLNVAQLARLRLPGGKAGPREAYTARLRVAGGAAILGALCWLIDRTACSAIPPHLNPQLHAWWHALGALSLHEALVCAGMGGEAGAPRVRTLPFTLGLLSTVDA
jgi:hypothetical protein